MAAPKPHPGQWQDGSFLDHFTAAVSHLGPENIGVAWGLAGIPWQSEADRTGFLNALTEIPWDQAQKEGP